MVEEILNIDGTEEELLQEQESVNGYNKLWIAINQQIERRMPQTLQESRSTSPIGSSIGENSQKRNYKLPKVELKKFDDDLQCWLGWWAQFQNIDKDESLHITDKHQYLVQSMVPGSRAEKLVLSYPQIPENYPKIIAALRDRFGDEVLLTEVYVRKLLKLVIANASQSNKMCQLSTMYDEVESNLRALESLGVAIAFTE